MSYALAVIVILVVVLPEQDVLPLYGGVFALGVLALVPVSLSPADFPTFPALSVTSTLI